MSGDTHELTGVAEQLAEGSGFWRSCSGCHEMNEGVPLGEWSNIFKCNLGGGCRECGGLGVVWDNTDYSDFGDFCQQQDTALDLLRAIKRHGELACVEVSGPLHRSGGKQPPTKDVWQFPRHMIPDIDKVIGSPPAPVPPPHPADQDRSQESEA